MFFSDNATVKNFVCSCCSFFERIRVINDAVNFEGTKFRKNITFLDSAEGGPGKWTKMKNGFKSFSVGYNNNLILFARIHTNDALHFGCNKFRKISFFWVPRGAGEMVKMKKKFTGVR